MVFPGVLRGRPGPRLATIHTSRPRRSLSSPWMSFTVQCSAAKTPRAQCLARGLACKEPCLVYRPRARAAPPVWDGRNRTCGRRLTKSTRSRAASRNLSPRGPRAGRRLVARPHTSVASLFAARGPRLHPTYAPPQRRSRAFSRHPRTLREKRRRATERPVVAAFPGPGRACLEGRAPATNTQGSGP